MPVREKRRRSPGSQPTRPFSRPQPLAERRQSEGLFAYSLQGSLLRQTGCWSKADSNSESHPRATPPAATRFVADSALEGGVYCELVSEVGLRRLANKARFQGVYG